MGGRRRPTFDVGHARELYESGLTAEQVGQVLGVDKTTICRHLHRAGLIRPGPPKRPLVSTERIVELRDQGLIWREVGAAVGLSEASARHRYWAAKGVPRVRGQSWRVPKPPQPAPAPSERKPPRWSDEQLLEFKAMGATHSQVAEATGMTYQAVANRLYRIRRRRERS